MWVLAGLVIGLVIAVAAAVVLLAMRRRSPAPDKAPEMTAEQWTTLGVIFVGAGTAMMATMGPYMIPMVILGVIYLGMGARAKRTRHK